MKKLLFIGVFLAWLCGIAGAAITIGTPCSASNNFGDTASVACNIGSSAGRILIVAFGWDGGGNNPLSNFGTFTYAGSNLILVGQSNHSTANRHCAIWRTAVDSQSGSNTLAINLNGINSTFGIAAIPLSGVDSSTPVDAVATGEGSGSPFSVTVTTGASGDLVIDCVYNSYDAGSAGLTPGTGQTEHVDLSLATGSRSFGVSSEAGAASVAMTWTSSGTPGTWAGAAVNVNASGGGGAPTVVKHRRLR